MDLRVLNQFFRIFTATAIFCCGWQSFAGDDSKAAIDRLRELKAANHITAKETLLRQEFLDRLIFQINTNFKGGDLHEFMRRTLSQMAHRNPESPMHDFLLQATRLLEQRQEKFENPVELVHRFMQAGGILKPLPAEQFLAAQSYSNGERSESVTGLNREELGDFVDKVAPQSHQHDSFIPVLKSVEIRE